MRYDVALLQVDIIDELDKMVKLKDEYNGIEAKIQSNSRKASFFDRAAIGYILHPYALCSMFFAINLNVITEEYTHEL
jgi:hypothetical protein